jgi:hypothetical protein
MEQIMGTLRTMLAHNEEQMLARMDANRKTDKEEMNASQKEMLAKMERMMTTNQTGVKLKELTESVEKNVRNQPQLT